MKRLRRIVLVNLVLLVGLLVAGEVGLRVHREGGWRAGLRSLVGGEAMPRHLGAGEWLLADEELGYRLDPALPAVNELGMRDVELPAEKTAGRRRVIVLGDSVAWEEPGFVSLLREALAEVGEVYNAAVPGYTTWQERLALERLPSAAAPDLVLLQYCVNDNHRFLHRFDEQGRFLWTQEARRTILPPGDGWLSRLQRRSYLAIEWRRWRLRRSSRTGAGLGSTLPWEGREDVGAAWQEASWPKQAEHLGAMRERARALGAGFAVLAVPWEPQLDARLLQREPESSLMPQRELAAICARAGIPFLDLHPELCGERPGTLFRDEIHLTEEGHARVARRVAAFLREEGLLGDW